MRIVVELFDADGKPVRKGWIEAEDVFDAILPAIDRAHELCVASAHIQRARVIEEGEVVNVGS